MVILILILYLWLGSKSITFFKTRILGIDCIHIETISDFIFRNVFWALILGWITIPLWIIFSLLGIGKK